MRHHHDAPACAAGGCAADALASRRAFLRDATAAVAGILVALGAAPAAAAALPTRLTAATNGGAAARGELRYPIPAADGAELDGENEIILVRWQGAVYAFDLACPHQHTALRWLAEERRFQCPKHKSRYQPDGTFISGRATRGMDRFPVRRDGAQIVVNAAESIHEDESRAAWDAAVVRV